MDHLDNNPQFWQTHRQQLYYFVLKRIHDPQEAEDIVQEVLARVYARLETLSSRDKFVPWLYQITRNAIVDHYRRAKPSADLSDSLAALEAEDLKSVYEQLAPCMRPLIEQLPSPYREAMQWSEIEGLTQQAVASKMGISLPGAKSQVQRGRKKLKALLQQCCQLQLNSDGKLLDYKVKEACQPCDPPCG